MVNLITEKFYTKSVNPYQVQFNEQKQKQNVQNSIVNSSITEQIDVKPKHKKNTLLPSTLIAGGGLLLYLGLRKPSAQKIYNNVVNEKVSRMECVIYDFTTFVRNSLRDVEKEATKLIDDYREKRFIDPNENLAIFKSLKNPHRLVAAQDLGFESIINSDKMRYHAGASDFDTFSIMLTKLTNAAKEKMYKEQKSVNLELRDLTRISGNTAEKNVDLVEACENRLVDIANFRQEQLSKIIEREVSSTSKQLLKKMISTIMESRSRIKQGKMNIIDTSYAQMRRLLKNNDLKPTYDTIPQTVGLESLTPEQLNSRTIPCILKNEEEYNSYIKALKTKDFSNLTDKDLYEIFYSSYYDNNLQDLGFLIDRLRLRQAIYKSKYPDKQSIYDTMVTKLQYLSAKLHEYGKHELFNTVNKDFNGTSFESKQVRVYYISRVAKRLGYNSIDEVDAVLLKEYPEYANLSIREFIKVFKDNPDLYFK